jgi:hypothetical protein
MIAQFGSGFPPHSMSSNHSNGSVVDSFYDVKLCMNLYVAAPHWPQLWQEINEVCAFNQEVLTSEVTAPHIINLCPTWKWVSSFTLPSTWYAVGWVDPTASFRESQNSVFLGVQPWLTDWLSYASLTVCSVAVFPNLYFSRIPFGFERTPRILTSSSCKYSVRMMTIRR